MNKNYSITINNPKTIGIDHIDKSKIQYMTGQLEKGENGTIHM